MHQFTIYLYIFHLLLSASGCVSAVGLELSNYGVEKNGSIYIENNILMLSKPHHVHYLKQRVINDGVYFRGPGISKLHEKYPYAEGQGTQRDKWI